MLIAILSPSVKHDGLKAPPADPVVGDAYVVAAGGEGAWLGLDGSLVEWRSNGWAVLNDGALEAGRAFIVAAGAGGSFLGYDQQIAVVVSLWTSSYAYRFLLPFDGSVVSCTQSPTYDGSLFVYSNEIGGWSRHSPGGGSGVTDHAALLNLDAAHAGHTGFEYTANKDQAGGYAGLDGQRYIDGDRLPAMSTTKRGGVPATGTPAGLFLRDDGTFASVGGGGAHAIGGASHVADTLANLNTKVTDAVIESTTGSAAKVSAHVLESDPHTQYQLDSERGQPSGYASLNTLSKVEQTALAADTAPWSGLSGVPSTFTPSAHTHVGGDVTSQVSSAASADAVPWTGVSGKPSTFDPSPHTHGGGDITSQVGSAAAADAVPWTGVSGKPSTFDPSPHTHGGGDITSQVSSAASADAVPWTGVTNPPATYAPSAHGHAQADVTNLVTDLSSKETPSGAQSKVDAHKDLTTGVHGAGVSTLATTANIATHAGLSSSVHGFDASGNAPPQSHNNAAHSESYAKDADLSTHTGLTTTAHGGILPSSSFSGLAKITVGTVPPTNPSVGDLWIDCS
jgi:hypothetical protein